MIQNKICIKCNIEKPVSEFHPRKDSKDGYRNQCKCCNANRTKTYYQANKVRIIEQVKQYRQANKVKIIQRVKRHRQANKDKITEYHKQYRQTNKVKILEQKKQHYKTNKVKILEQQKQYQRVNREKKSEYDKQYRQDNKYKIKEYKKQYSQTPQGRLVDKTHSHKRRMQKINNTSSGKHFTIKDVTEKLKLQKHKCVYCKESLKDYFEVDHILALSKGGSNEASNIQLLCKNCNRGQDGKWDKDITDFAHKHGMLF